MLPQLIPPYKAVPKRMRMNAQNSIPYAAGVEKTVVLDKGVVLASLDLMLRGTYTTSASHLGTRREYNPYELVKNLRVTCGDDLFNCSGLAAMVIQAARSKRVKYYTSLTSTQIAAVSTGATFDGRLVASFVEPFSEPEHAGLIPTGLFGDGQCVVGITWGINTDIADSSDATLSAIDCQVGLNTVLPDVVSPVGYGSFRAIALRTIAGGLTSNNPAFPVDLGRVAGAWLHYLVIITRQGATALPSNAPQTADGMVRLKVAGIPVLERTWRMLRGTTQSMLPPNFATVSAGSGGVVGIIVVPFGKGEEDDGGMAIQTGAQALPSTVSNILEMDITGAATNDVEVVAIVYRDPVKTAGAWNLAA